MNHLVLLGKRHLRFVVKERMAHDRADRFHQGLGGRVSGRQAGSANDTGLKGMVVCRSRLGGMLNFYRREAA